MKTTLVIMAAGLGSRYGGNKQVDGIGPGGEILMQYSVYDAIRAGFNKVVFIIKEEHRHIIEGFCENIRGAEIEFVYQDYSSIPSFYKVPSERTKPFGTTHAVLCAKNVVNEPFAVINADDYYGSEAFAEIYNKLNAIQSGEAVMVAYKLKNTVSRNGSVSRGVCNASYGKLTSVTETYNITVDDNGVISDDADGVLDPETLVSMNLWGFLPEFFNYAEDYFDDFLRNLPEGELKKECALPTMVDSLIKKGELDVSVLSTDSVWFGVTYKEDKAYVAGELRKMHESGKYPEKL